MGTTDDLDNQQVYTFHVGPTGSIADLLQEVAAEVRSLLTIEAQSSGRTPAAISHDLIETADGFEATVLIATQAGLAD